MILKIIDAQGFGLIYKGRMSTKGTSSDTPTAKLPLVAVHGETYLFRRGATYYFRVKVPQSARAALKKKEIRHSLKTKDKAEAKRLCDLERQKAKALIDAATPKKPKVPTPLSEPEIFYMVASWFVAKERENEAWVMSERPSITEDERETILYNLKGDAAAFGSDADERVFWAKSVVAEILESFPNVCVLPGSADYNNLLGRAERAINEHLYRKIDRIAGQKVKGAQEADFKALFSHSALQAPKPTVTLKVLVDEFMAHQHAKNANTTPVSYHIPCRILLEVLGENALVADITPAHIAKVCEALERVPTFSAQRFPGLTLLQATAKADKERSAQRMSAHSVFKYYISICAIFNFAKDSDWIDKCPTGGRRLKDRFGKKPRSKPTAHFTIEELNAIFRAPLYAGCIDDEINFSKPGPNHPKRGRFWVPLLALFHGVRCNEACQLYAEDVKEDGGIPYLYIRTTLDDHEKAKDKSIKNENSVRRVPLHPQIIKLGFLDFVEARRSEDPKARLFSEIKQGKSTKRYSTYFSRWFTRFKKHACGHQPKARLHSFRHQFRTALGNAGVPLELTREICGWDDSESDIEKHYFKGYLKQKAEAVAKVSYEGLDLSHLEGNPSPHIEKKQRVRYRP